MGEIVTDATGARATVIVDFPVTAPTVAEIVALPAASATTKPAGLTDATAGAELDQANETPAIAREFESAAAAVSWRVCVVSRLAEGGVTAIVATTCCTVMVVVSALPPAVATMRADPFASDVTRPVASTVAMVVARDDHVKAVPGTTLPATSVACACRRTLAPSEFKRAVAGVTVTCASPPTPAEAVNVTGARVPTLARTDC